MPVIGDFVLILTQVITDTVVGIIATVAVSIGLRDMISKADLKA